MEAISTETRMSLAHRVLRALVWLDDKSEQGLILDLRERIEALERLAYAPSRRAIISSSPTREPASASVTSSEAHHGLR